MNTTGKGGREYWTGRPSDEVVDRLMVAIRRVELGQSWPNDEVVKHWAKYQRRRRAMAFQGDGVMLIPRRSGRFKLGETS